MDGANDIRYFRLREDLGKKREAQSSGLCCHLQPGLSSPSPARSLLSPVYSCKECPSERSMPGNGTSRAEVEATLTWSPEPCALLVCTFPTLTRPRKVPSCLLLSLLAGSMRPRGKKISLLPTHTLSQIFAFTSYSLLPGQKAGETLTSAARDGHVDTAHSPGHDLLTWAGPGLVQIPILVVFIFRRGGWGLFFTGGQLINRHLVGDACRGDKEAEIRPRCVFPRTKECMKNSRGFSSIALPSQAPFHPPLLEEPL